MKKMKIMMMTMMMMMIILTMNMMMMKSSCQSCLQEEQTAGICQEVAVTVPTSCLRRLMDQT